MNPIQMLQVFFGRGMSPQQIVGQIGNRNPMIMNLIKMAQNGDDKSIETFARNLYKEKRPNGDFDKDFAEFRSNFK